MLKEDLILQILLKHEQSARAIRVVALSLSPPNSERCNPFRCAREIQEEKSARTLLRLALRRALGKYDNKNNFLGFLCEFRAWNRHI